MRWAWWGWARRRVRRRGTGRRERRRGAGRGRWRRGRGRWRRGRGRWRRGRGRWRWRGWRQLKVCILWWRGVDVSIGAVRISQPCGLRVGDQIRIHGSGAGGVGRRVHYGHSHGDAGVVGSGLSGRHLFVLVQAGSLRRLVLLAVGSNVVDVHGGTGMRPGGPAGVWVVAKRRGCLLRDDSHKRGLIKGGHCLVWEVHQELNGRLRRRRRRARWRRRGRGRGAGRRRRAGRGRRRVWHRADLPGGEGAAVIQIPQPQPWEPAVLPRWRCGIDGTQVLGGAVLAVLQGDKQQQKSAGQAGAARACATLRAAPRRQVMQTAAAAGKGRLRTMGAAASNAAVVKLFARCTGPTAPAGRSAPQQRVTKPAKSDGNAPGCAAGSGWGRCLQAPAPSAQGCPSKHGCLRKHPSPGHSGSHRRAWHGCAPGNKSTTHDT